VVCRACGQLVEADRVLCPHCRAPIAAIDPPSRRVNAIVALVLIIVAIALCLRVLIVYRGA
jgi:hypothetical protein